MFYTIVDDLILYQLISFIKRYTNFELKLREYFAQKTEGIYPEFIIVINEFIFFFVKKKDYLKSQIHLKAMRRQISLRKIIIIRTERILINLLFSLFPDLNIDDIKIELDEISGAREISIYFLFFKERGIAIGRNGDYIRAVNQIFEKYVIFENNNIPLKIKCKFKN
ncbi:MAG: KH domain-containing protein [Promethearchaeota archaeon]